MLIFAPPSRNMTEAPIKRDWTKAYRERKAALASDEVRRSLELAEEAISVDPVHRSGRHAIGDVIIDANEPGLMVSFRVESDGTVLFVTFRDLWNR